MVKGVVLSINNDVEAVTVFNKSTKQGTITDAKGAFNLKVALNDVIEISALQFQPVTIIINPEMVNTKQLEIKLVEAVNTLDAVTLTSGLSGNMGADISHVKITKPIAIDMGSIHADFEYNDDKAFDNSVVQDHLTSITDPYALKNLPDLFKIIKLFTKSRKSAKIKKAVFTGDTYKKPKDIFSVYTFAEIQEQFDISEADMPLFMAFIENTGTDANISKPENEILLVDFLIKQKQLFLKQSHVKN